MLCDLTGLADADLRGAVLLRVSLWVLKHIGDEHLPEQLPGITGLLRELGEKPTALGYSEALLRYLAAAAETVSEADLRTAISRALPQVEEQLMATLAQQWLEQGRQEGRQEGQQEGRQEGQIEGIQTGQMQVLMRLLERRFGTISEVYRDRIATADAETLLRWSERVLSAERLQDVFDEPR